MLKFEFTERMAAVIAEALTNMPYKIAAPVILEMQKQIIAQQQAQLQQSDQPPEQKSQGNGSEATL